MCILDDPQYRSSRCQAGELVDQNGEGTITALLRRQHRRSVARLSIDTEQCSKEWRRLSDVITASGEKRLQPFKATIRIVFRSKACRKVELLDNWVKSGIRVVG